MPADRSLQPDDAASLPYPGELAGMPGGGRVRKADAQRSGKAGEAIHRVDFRRRVLGVRITTGILSHVTDVVASQRLVDAAAPAYELSRLSRPPRPRPRPGMPARMVKVHYRRVAL